MAARSSLAIGAVGLGAAAIMFYLGQGTAPSLPGVNSAAAELDAKLREASAGVHARATTLAQAPRLSAAVATDVATVHNLTQDELAFRPQLGEIIEIAQVRLDGSVVSLLRLPDGAASIADLTHAGLSVTRGERGVMMTEVVDVKPDSRKEIDHGALAVSWPLDTRDAEARLEALGVPARFEVAGKTVFATRRPIPFEGRVVRVPVDVVSGAVVVEAQEEPGITPLRGASGGVALVAVILAAATWRRRGRPGSDRLPAGPDRPLAKGSDPEKKPSAVISSGEIRVNTKPGVAPPPPPSTIRAASSPRDADPALARTSVVQAVPESVIVKPTTFGRYAVQRKLGSGGMAEVYLANSTGEAGFTKPVALKIMHAHLATNSQIVDHFLDEARIASRLSHPNIVQIIDLGKEGDNYFIAMEFVDGVDLGQLISDTRMKGQTASETAAAKIWRVLPQRLARRLDTVLESLSFTEPPGTFPTPDTGVLLTLADAVRHRRPVAIRYTDRGGRRSDRTVHPYGVVAHAGRWYVTGEDPGAAEDRTFRLDRIADARTLPGSFEAVAGQDPAQRVLAGFAEAAYRYEVTLRIHGTVEQVRARLPAGVARVAETGPAADADPATERWLLVDLRAERLDWLPPVLASLDRPFVIERPAELRDLVVAFANRLAACARST